jgi:hypothetical protein
MIGLQMPGIAPGKTVHIVGVNKSVERKIRNVAGEKVLVKVRESDIGVFSHADSEHAVKLSAKPDKQPEKIYNAVLVRVVDDEEGHFLAVEIQLDADSGIY